MAVAYGWHPAFGRGFVHPVDQLYRDAGRAYHSPSLFAFTLWINAFEGTTTSAFPVRSS